MAPKRSGASKTWKKTGFCGVGCRALLLNVNAANSGL